MKAVVIYSSKYGHTRQYAQWISQELECDLLECSKAKGAMLDGYDRIIYGGGLYAGGVSGLSFLTKHYSRIAHKDVALFTCGLGDPEVEENVLNIRNSLAKALTPEMMGKIAIFHLRGGMDYRTLGPLHRGMMAMVRKGVEKKDRETWTEEDRELSRTYGESVDFTDRETIGPIVAWAKGTASGGEGK